MLNKKYLKRKVVIISMLGCLILIIANFLPIIKITSDTLEYTRTFRFATYEGKYIIFLAVVALLLLLLEEPKCAIFPLLAISIILGYLVSNKSALYKDCSFYEDMFSWGIGLYMLIVGNVIAYVASIAEFLKGRITISFKKQK
jgi:hypothetical protein